MHMVKIKHGATRGYQQIEWEGRARKGNNGIQGDGGYQNRTDGQRVKPRLTDGYFDKGK